MRSFKAQRSFASLALAAVAVVSLASCSTIQRDTSSESGGGAAAITDLQIIVPADPGGGWDQTGRALSQVLTDDGLVDSAPVTNVPGAGGNVGLASLATETDPNTLLVCGLVMVGAVETNQGANRMEDTTPIARLTDEPLVVVVPADSPYQSLGDLIDDIVANGQDVTITGGSAGGADHILAGLMLEQAGLSGTEIASSLNYIPNSGGAEAVTLILGNNASAAISGIGEFVQYVEDGSMRALAVSSAETAPLLPDTPTITEEGLDVVLTNWRGVLAPADITDAERQALIDVVTELHASGTWTSEVETRGWNDAFLTGDEFASYLDTNISDIQTTLSNIGLTA